MSNPFTGQISIFGFPYAPYSWAFCDGSMVPINQFGALYALVGTTFGGNGTSQFGLPDLGAASPCGTGVGPGLTQRVLGQTFGTPAVTLDPTTLPAHTHTVEANGLPRGTIGQSMPTATSSLTTSSNVEAYSDGGATIVMSAGAVSPVGGGAAHNNMQPYIALNYCIALSGIFPYFD